MDIYDIEVTTMEGGARTLEAYRGQVLFIVNVASRCGLTPQYSGLQALHERYVGHGLRVLAFPSNDFGAQEPGTNDEIRELCSSKFGVTFELFDKIRVKGPDAAPLYAFLTSLRTNRVYGGEIRWNFDKFLIDRAGRIVDRFEPRMDPTDPTIVSVIERTLA